MVPEQAVETIPCVQCGTTDSADGDWYRLCGACRWTDERNTIAAVVTHWFTQGGEAQFGSLGEPENADELVAAILTVIRASQAVLLRQIEEVEKEMRVRVVLDGPLGDHGEQNEIETWADTLQQLRSTAGG